MSISNVTMNAKDSLSAKLAECFVTIGENRYNAFNFIKFEGKLKKKKQTVAILGKTGSGNKSTGWDGTFTAEMHYNVSIYRQMLLDYKNTGADTYFEIQITNEDTTSAAGRQTVVFKNCNLDEGILSMFDASSDNPLSESVSGTFDDFEIPESFTLLDGML